MIQINKDIKVKNVANIINEKSPSFSGIVTLSELMQYLQITKIFPRNINL